MNIMRHLRSASLFMFLHESYLFAIARNIKVHRAETESEVSLPASWSVVPRGAPFAILPLTSVENGGDSRGASNQRAFAFFTREVYLARTIARTLRFLLHHFWWLQHCSSAAPAYCQYWRNFGHTVL